MNDCHVTGCCAGGIRLDPSSAPLWAGLGTCAKQACDQEYAFTRSLQLDPKSAHTWAALGRLYMESGARSLADTCFTQARSQEPADSATWAAMGALAGLSATGDTTPAFVPKHPEACHSLGGGVGRQGCKPVLDMIKAAPPPALPDHSKSPAVSDSGY